MCSLRAVLNTMARSYAFILTLTAILLLLAKNDGAPTGRKLNRKTVNIVDVSVIGKAKKLIKISPEKSILLLETLKHGEKPGRDDPIWFVRTIVMRNNTYRNRPRRRKRNPRVNQDHSVAVSERPTNAWVYKIRNRAGFFLRLCVDGTVDGTMDKNDQQTLLLFESHGPSIIRIKGIHSNRYLTLDRAGKASVHKSPTLDDSLFRWTREENLWDSFASYRYYFDQKFDMLLGITKDGLVKKPWRTGPGQHATQFVAVKQGLR